MRAKHADVVLPVEPKQLGGSHVITVAFLGIVESSAVSPNASPALSTLTADRNIDRLTSFPWLFESP